MTMGWLHFILLGQAAGLQALGQEEQKNGGKAKSLEMFLELSLEHVAGQADIHIGLEGLKAFEVVKEIRYDFVFRSRHMTFFSHLILPKDQEQYDGYFHNPILLPACWSGASIAHHLSEVSCCPVYSLP